MGKKQLTLDEKKQYIVKIIASEKPATVSKLMELIRREYSFSDEEISKILIQLEQENKLHFNLFQNPRTLTPKVYFFSSRAKWYWTTLSITLATVIVVFLIPANDYPLSYFRLSIGAIFLLCLPGFAITKVLFPGKTSKEMDIVEWSALSLCVSLGLIPIVGLIMNYSPWGIKLAPITLGLVGLTGIFATLAILREYRMVLVNIRKSSETIKIK